MALCVVPPVYCHAESSGCDYSTESVIFHFLQCIKNNSTVLRLAFFFFISFSVNSVRTKGKSSLIFHSVQATEFPLSTHTVLYG